MTEEFTANHINHQQRHTLEKVFQHPLGHNIEWHDVRSLLAALATVEEHSDGRLHVTLDSSSLVLSPGTNKDLTGDEVMSLRHFLANAGVGPTSA